MTDKEKQSSAQLNSLTNTVVGATGYGALLGVFTTASKIGQGMIPHKVCFDKDGGSVTVYDTKLNKYVGAFLKPTHEYVLDYVAQKKYGDAALSLLGIYGQLKSVQEQENVKNCVTIKPDDYITLNAKRIAEENARLQQKAIADAAAASAAKRKRLTEFYKNPYFWLILVGILLLIFITVSLIRYKKSLKK